MKKIKILIVLVLLALFYGSDNPVPCIAYQDYNSTTKLQTSCLANTDCESNERCYNNVCELCKKEGEFSPNLELCCEGLNRLDDNGRCVFVCDPNDGCFITVHTSQENSSEEIKNMLGYIFGLVGSVFLFVMIISAALYTVLSGNKKRAFLLKRIFVIATVGFVISLFAIFCLTILNNNMGF